VPHTLLHPTVADPGHLLSVHTATDPRPGRVVVEVVGEVDSETAPALDLCLRSQAGQPGVGELVVDLTGVTFLGAAGVEVLARADRRLRGRAGRLIVRTGGRRAVLCSLRLIGFAGLVDPDERERVPGGGAPAPPVRAARGHHVVAAARQ
jgi:anti-anti-sigma factor